MPNKGRVPTGRLVIIGTVLSVKTVNNQFGIQEKCMIEARDGYRCWGSRFGSIIKGDVVEFKATMEPSKDDPYFGFYKRPILVELLATALNPLPVNSPVGCEMPSTDGEELPF